VSNVERSLRIGAWKKVRYGGDELLVEVCLECKFMLLIYMLAWSGPRCTQVTVSSRSILNTIQSFSLDTTRVLNEELIGKDQTHTHLAESAPPLKIDIYVTRC
jgi:hypothetical protein